MKRKIIRIDEEKCNGCGQCVPDCPEGALQVLDGKARLVSDLFCDGLGACLKACPEGAISVEEREAEAYDERRVMANIIEKGPETVRAHLTHLREHGEHACLQEAVALLRERGIPVPADAVHGHGPHGHGCPGSRMIDLRKPESRVSADGGAPVASGLRQWPVHLKLVNPGAAYFDNADLLIAADCTPFAFGDFHRTFLAGKIVIMFCPKLDPYVEEYVEKLAEIFSSRAVKSVSVVRMEVPCCGGATAIVKEAMKRSGKSIPVLEHTISVRGEIL